MNIKAQGHLLTFVEGHSDTTFSNIFSLETARPIKAKLYVEPPWDIGIWKWVEMILSHNQDGRRANIREKPELGVRYWLREYYKICSNDDPGLTLTNFTVWENA